MALRWFAKMRRSREAKVSLLFPSASPHPLAMHLGIEVPKVAAKPMAVVIHQDEHGEGLVLSIPYTAH